MTKRTKYHLLTCDLIPKLLIDSITLDHAKNNQQNLSTAWMDYRKTFDLIPHALQETADLDTFTEKILNGKLHFLCSDGCLDCTLKIHKFLPKITSFLSVIVKNWKSSLQISAPNRTNSTNLINILKYLFQCNCP